MPQPDCFLSYSWDSEEHKLWVRTLATRLMDAGINTRLDQWDLHPGADLARFMESSITQSNYVILVCTPTYARKALKGKGGVGFESSIITGEIFDSIGEESKFVPILRAGEPHDALPAYLRPRMYIDFRQDSGFSRGLEELVRHCFQRPAIARPLLGRAPSYITTDRTVFREAGDDEQMAYESEPIEGAQVNQDLCVGCGLCEQLCPDMFTLERNGKATTTDTASRGASCVQDAIDQCPVSAIAPAYHATLTNDEALPRIDDELCVSCGLCAQVCPSVFEAQWGAVARIRPGASADALCIQEAIDQCPVAAIG